RRGPQMLYLRIGEVSALSLLNEQRCALPIDRGPRPGPRRPPHIDRAASRTGTATAPGPRGHTARPGTVSDRAVTLVTADGTAIPVGTVTDRHPRRKDPPCSPDPI